MPEAVQEPAEEQLDEILQALYRMRDGDFSVRLRKRGNGTIREIASVFNEVVDHSEQLNSELQRVGEVVREEGRLGERVAVNPARRSEERRVGKECRSRGGAGEWRDQRIEVTRTEL